MHWKGNMHNTKPVDQHTIISKKGRTMSFGKWNHRIFGNGRHVAIAIISVLVLLTCVSIGKACDYPWDDEGEFPSCCNIKDEIPHISGSRDVYDENDDVWGHQITVTWTIDDEKIVRQFYLKDGDEGPYTRDQEPSVPQDDGEERKVLEDPPGDPVVTQDKKLRWDDGTEIVQEENPDGSFTATCTGPNGLERWTGDWTGSIGSPKNSGTEKNTSITRGGVLTQMYYDVTGGDNDVDTLDKVVQGDSSGHRSLTFYHYEDDGTYITRKRVTEVTFDSDRNARIKTSIYGYYGDGSDANNIGEMKFVVRPEGVARYLADNGYDKGVRFDSANPNAPLLQCGLDTADAGTLSSLDRTDLAFYASEIVYDYNEEGKPTKVAQGNGGCCGSPDVGITYYEYGPADKRTPTDDYSDWETWRRTRHPNGLRIVEFYNAKKEMVFEVTQEMDDANGIVELSGVSSPNKKIWIMHNVYYDSGESDVAGLLKERRHPSACKGYDANVVTVTSAAQDIMNGEWVADFDDGLAPSDHNAGVDDSGTTGLVDVYAYDPNSLRVSEKSIREGPGGTKKDVFKRTYTNGSGSVWRLASEVVYDPALDTPGDSDGYKATYDYTYDPSDANAVVTKTVTYPSVATANNGPGAGSDPNVVYHYHSDDANGLHYNDWTRHEDGTFSYRKLGTGTWTHGRVVKEVRDVHDNCGLTPPAGWSLPDSDDAVGLTTVYEYYDDPNQEGSLGRLKRREEEGVGGNEIETVYAYMSRRTFGDDGTGCDKTLTTTHVIHLSSVCDDEEYNNVPMSIEVSDLAGRSVTSAAGVPADYVSSWSNLVDAFEEGDMDDNENGYYNRDYSFGQTLMTIVDGVKGTLTSHVETRYVYDMNDGGALVRKEVDRWTNAEDDSETILTSKTIYDENTARVKRTIGEDGTVMDPVYDQLGRVIERKQAASTSGNLKTVSKQFYDEVNTSNEPAPGSENQGVGDGHVTQRRSVYDKGGVEEYYATLSKYDYRGRVEQVRARGLTTKYTEAASGSGKVRTVETYVETTPDWSPDVDELRSKQESYYDERGRVFQTRSYADQAGADASNYLTTNHWYDARGRLIKTSDPNGLYRKIAYDGLGRQVASYVCYDTTECNQGNATTSDYADADDVDGDVVLQQTRTIYYGGGQPIKHWSYQRHDNATATGELTKVNARVSLTANWYDEIGRPVCTASYGALASTDWYEGDLADYDPARSGSQDWNDCDWGSKPLPDDDIRVSKTEYDSKGRAHKQIDNTGRETRLVFNDLGQTTKTIENYVNGNATDGTSDEDRTTEYIYDDSGRLEKIKATNVNSGGTTEYQETTYSYDDTIDASRATKTTYPDNGQVTVTYDCLGRVLTSTNQNGTKHTFVYDDTTGQLLKDRVTVLGSADDHVQSVVYAYDDLGRVETVTTYSNNDGTGTVRSQVKKTYGDWGQLTSSAQEHGDVVGTGTPTVQYQLDVSSPDASGAVGYVRLGKMIYPNSREVSYDYGVDESADDILSRVADIVDDDGSTKLAEYTYLGAGTIVQTARPEVTGGLTLSYGSGGSYSGIDRFGQIIDHAWKNTAGTAIDRFQYGYDRGGNRTWRKSTITHGDAGTPDLDEQYLYDGLDRLMKTNRGTLDVNNEITDPNAGFSQAWATWNSTESRWDTALDAVGNWKTFQQDDNGGGTGGNGWELDQSRTHNAVNEITDTSGESWKQPTHDQAGNMTAAPAPGDETSTAHQYVYDAWNRLVAVWVDDGDGTREPATEDIATYQYDGLGRRIVRTDCTPATDVVYHDYYTPSWQLIEVRKDGQAAADLHKQFVWGLRYIDAPLLRDRETDAGSAGLDERLYYTQDGNFNVTALVNPAGDVVERYSYDAYGQVTVRNGAENVDPDTVNDPATQWDPDPDNASDVDNRLLYCGYRYDAETGLYHVRHRYLHPALGRWTTRDPLGYVDGLNLYEYCGSNAHGRLDPYGTTSIGFEEMRAIEEAERWEQLNSTSEDNAIVGVDCEELEKKRRRYETLVKMTKWFIAQWNRDVDDYTGCVNEMQDWLAPIDKARRDLKRLNDAAAYNRDLASTYSDMAMILGVSSLQEGMIAGGYAHAAQRHAIEVLSTSGGTARVVSSKLAARGRLFGRATLYTAAAGLGFAVSAKSAQETAEEQERKAQYIEKWLAGRRKNEIEARDLLDKYNDKLGRAKEYLGKGRDELSEYKARLKAVKAKIKECCSE